MIAPAFCYGVNPVDFAAISVDQVHVALIREPVRRSASYNVESRTKLTGELVKQNSLRFVAFESPDLRQVAFAKYWPEEDLRATT